MTPDTVAARSAIESLRNGVPSRHAVAQLGSTQHRLRDRFHASLDALEAGSGTTPLVVAANFGAGKSHLLSCLRLAAEQAGYVTAAIVVSPESPLGNPRAILKAIAEEAHASQRTGNALRSLLAEPGASAALSFNLRQWVRRERLDDRFAALLQIYEDFRADEELREQVLADFEDRPLSRTTIKGKLKELGLAGDYDLSGPASTLLAHDRLRLHGELFRRCGGKGLVVLFDELERLAKFSLNQRLQALAEIGWWCDQARREGTSLVPVFAMTDLFLQTSVTGGSRDADRFVSPDDERDRLGRLAVEVLSAHETLDPPDEQQEAQVQYRLRGLYELAYDRAVPPLPPERYDPLTPMRYKIRKWIARWDLQRYAPDYTPEFEVDAMRFDPTQFADDDSLADLSGE